MKKLHYLTGQFILEYKDENKLSKQKTLELFEVLLNLLHYFWKYKDEKNV